MKDALCIFGIQESCWRHAMLTFIIPTCNLSGGDGCWGQDGDKLLEFNHSEEGQEGRPWNLLKFGFVGCLNQWQLSPIMTRFT
jgi:hypothetical protein